RDKLVTGVQTCALPICRRRGAVLGAGALAGEDIGGPAGAGEQGERDAAPVEMRSPVPDRKQEEQAGSREGDPQEIGAAARGQQRSEERRVGKEGGRGGG